MDTTFNKLDELLAKKTETINEILDDYKKLHDYIKPFLDANPEMSKRAESINMKLMCIPIDDLIIMTSIMSMNKIAMDLLGQQRLNMQELAKQAGLPEELFDVGPTKAR
jgi:hypothetical protein